MTGLPVRDPTAMRRLPLLHSTRHPATFARFALVATCVSLIDIGLLYALHAGVGFNVYAARVVSFAAAISVGYRFNRRFTFHWHRRSRGLAAELARFYAVFGTGACVNYGVFALVVALGHWTGLSGAAAFWLPLAGVWLGGVCGMCLNYWAARRLVFQRA